MSRSTQSERWPGRRARQRAPGRGERRRRPARGALAGSAAANRLEGRSGSDQIAGGAGRDTLTGSGGVDTLDALDAAGGDRVECGEGADVALDAGDIVGAEHSAAGAACEQVSWALRLAASNLRYSACAGVYGVPPVDCTARVREMCGLHAHAACAGAGGRAPRSPRPAGR
jgi:hypothetical protein